uniref:Uncharacterized protein n=1 Tax=Arundo donax TaxID=35708 RepID=A0A0A9G0A3_ARUDO
MFSPRSPCCRGARCLEWFGEERCGGSQTGGAGSSGAATGTPSAPPTGSAIGGRPAWSSGSTTAETTPMG